MVSTYYSHSLVHESKPDDVTLLPDFTVVGTLNSEPKSLDKVLRGPDADKWKEALNYKISQLEKLGTWMVEDLPKGHSAIPCNEVLKIKRGPNGEFKNTMSEL